MCIRILQGNRINRMCVWILREICFKKLAHIIVEPAKSGSYRIGWLAGWRPREELMLQLKQEDSLDAEFLLGGSRAFLLRPSTDWVNHSHIMGYAQSLLT